MGFRTWRLLRPGFQQTPTGGRWYGLDYFSWNMIVGFIIVTAVLSVATGEEPVNIRQASMPQAIILYLASSQLIVTGLMAALGLKTPVRFSSTTRGSLMKPGIFVLIEDIVGVDGGGGPEFRDALMARYETSKVFRRLIAQMNWFWGIGSMIVAGGTTAIVYIVEDLNVVFALVRLVSPVDMGRNWCHLHSFVDQKNAEVGDSMEISSSTVGSYQPKMFGSV
ncbi:hypothetical protein LHYA1_G007826 [Lachnellula hyalina]|uniref:Uncharacterized protein n=1 Tax=Lachnellula hyalina TaxID=1316788 RepID=A0A8H8TWQ0_9HELO|nr:uncharacterized protein LHYA1_G007826 [Lachnellula hyalina]TVY23122.1 hypothetical protein LHYA1_G007826 [Lachnellula hyalina]